MGASAQYLVVEDDPTVARTVARCLRRSGAVQVAPTFADASETLARRDRWTAFVFDVGLPDGSGIDLLASVRSSGLETPALLLTASREDHVLRAAARHRATYLPKPFTPTELEAFARDALHANDASAALRRIVDSLAAEAGLSERERDIVYLTVAGVGRQDIADELGVSIATFNTYARRAVRKARRESWRELLDAISAELFQRTRDRRFRTS